MAKNFINEDFLLQSKTACSLYHEYAEKMPIYDYHCHISPTEIAEDKQYDNLTQIWLYGVVIDLGEGRSHDKKGEKQ